MILCNPVLFRNARCGRQDPLFPREGSSARRVLVLCASVRTGLTAQACACQQGAAPAGGIFLHPEFTHPVGSSTKAGSVGTAEGSAPHAGLSRRCTCVLILEARNPNPSRVRLPLQQPETRTSAGRTVILPVTVCVGGSSMAITLI